MLESLRLIAMPLLLLLLLLLPSTSPTVLYCDGVYQLADRTDESEASCLWSSQWMEQELEQDLEECRGSQMEEGLFCRGECVPYRDWCSPGTQVIALCHLLLVICLSSPAI